jgi:beta-lactamase class A
MSRRAILIFLAWAGLLSLAGPATAEEASPQLRAAAEQVVALLRGQGDLEAAFTPAFLAQVPPAQVRAISAQFAAQYGAVRSLAGIDAHNPQAGTIHIAYERATAHFNLVVQPNPPHRITGLQFTGADMRGDSIAAVLAEIRALPGMTGVAVARLSEGAPQIVAGNEPERPLAIGSTFKLFILAELSRQVQAGERRWSDVVTLDRRSSLSGTLQAWPQGSPLTLHTLAALMISISDNTATDILLHTLGREKVEQMMGMIGIAAAARNRPLLSTLEVGLIKTGPDAAAAAWRNADEAERRRLLATDFAARDPTRIDVARFTGNPLHIDSIEWFASSTDLARTMDWLRRNGDETARAIMAINPALPQQLRSAFPYVGYKGGSEPGVISLTWLIRDSAGAWHVVTGSWNNPQAPVDEPRFVGLLTRIVQQLRTASTP